MSVSAPNTLTPPVPPRFAWRHALLHLRGNPAQALVLGGSFIMLLGSGTVSGINFAYNMITARLLGPAAFGHASVAVTLLMLASAITLAFQLVCAKFVARNEGTAAKLNVIHHLGRQAWIIGALLAACLAAFSGTITAYLRLPGRGIVLLLALGILFYVPLGVKRGAMQGVCAFPRLSYNFILEVSVKFVAAWAFIELLLNRGPNIAVLGAVGAVALSVLVAYLFPTTGPKLRASSSSQRSEDCIPASFREGMQAIVFFVGQVLINNIDIVLVKHFFPPYEAGLYAAIALVGRVLYFAAWSVVSAMFPVAAGVKLHDENLSIISVPLAFVTLISFLFILFTGFFPEWIMHAAFGAHFLIPAKSLLSLYAATTGVYALSVVLMTYEMSRRIANTGWVQLAFSGLVITGIYIFHSTLREVVVVQLALMVLLLIAVSLPFFRIHRNNPALVEEGVA